MKPSEYLDFTPAGRNKIFDLIRQKNEDYFNHIGKLPVASVHSPGEIRQYLDQINFDQSLSPEQAIDFIIKGLDQYQVHTPHPGYFGLFNPASSTMSVAADSLAAAYNPQLAAWSHSPLPNEIENLLIREFGMHFYGHGKVDGTFTSGGAEANHTALLTALTHHFPEFHKEGLTAFTVKPTLYVSKESHHSFVKAARLCGLGSDSVRMIDVDSSCRMTPGKLKECVSEDRSKGFFPFFVAATAGTTSSGAIDPMDHIAGIAREEGLWFHADAAWGGAICLDPYLKNLLKGIEQADSITFDAHKWLSVSMAAGMYFTTHIDILYRTFGIETAYMPVKNNWVVTNPYHHSIQWSRRFTGLKLFLTLAVAGWEGYRTIIQNMMKMGNYLKDSLKKEGWILTNETPLPLACFAHKKDPGMDDLEYLENICSRVVRSGEAWISTTILNEKIPVLRACITNYRTEEKDIDRLIKCLDKAIKPV